MGATLATGDLPMPNNHLDAPQVRVVVHKRRTITKIFNPENQTCDHCEIG